MKQVKERIKYLSFRIILLMVMYGISAILILLFSLPPYITFLSFLSITVIGWFFIVKPYIKTEKTIELFLEGYDVSEKKELKTHAISPAIEKMFKQLQEVLSPAQLFNMNKRQAQYLALQNQINPHFLYNTLESIRSEALLSGLDDVAYMTESLAIFFRYTITKVENLVSVEEELQNCETYFSIQQYRFGERLKLEIKCSPDDKEEIFRCRLPKLTMQPILENSIIHGTELKIGTGHLTIYLELTEKRLLIRISDDGLGMDEETLTKINEKFGKDNFNITKHEESSNTGLALTNVDNRIRLLFGDEYGLHIFSIPGAGTDVDITLPAISSDRDVKNREVLQ